MTRATQRPAGMEYANARIRGSRVRLLGSDDYETLLGQSDLPGVIRTLGSWPQYRDYIEDAALTREGTTLVSTALQAKVVDEYDFVYQLMPQAERRQLHALVSLWDIEDLKSIVRGKAAGVPPEEIIESLTGLGQTIPRQDLLILARQEDLEAVVGTAVSLGMAFAPMFSEALIEYQAEGALTVFERELDRVWADNAVKESSRWGVRSGPVHEVITSEIDIINITTAMRATEVDREIDDLDRYFLPGGAAIDEAEFLRLAALDEPLEVLDALPVETFGNARRMAEEAYVIRGTVSSIEQGLRAGVGEGRIKRFGRDILGFGVAVGYLLSILYEVRNIRVIAFGKRFHMPDEMIRRELVVV